ncbi:hypothetical protein D6D10_07827 [Aureobasidium pullulans]|uniref:Uncharacterized protein n=1 Tax=Aureobasidium pullulans TaxID=5580 RepID=A0A4S9EKG9_AURPU|nr:hypothetical protein D6D10_07827 [Aureobasidium pullulans]TIA02396.1 hypothetical protein D6C82_02804 [Aureobasidium pullulans]
MCWGEQIISRCPHCQVLTTLTPTWLGCPFDHPLGSCDDAFVTTHHTIRPHYGCIITSTSNDVPRLRIVTELAEPWDAGSPHWSSVSPTDNTNSTTQFPQTGSMPAYALPLPPGWTADHRQQGHQSECMTMVTQYRRELVRVFQDLVQPVQQLRNSASFTNPRLNRTVMWCEDYMATLLDTAAIHIWLVQQAEDQINNGTVFTDAAKADLLMYSNDIRNAQYPFEVPLVWHRRFTDLFIHLRRVIGELTPQPAQNTAFQPTHRRRGAISEGDVNKAVTVVMHERKGDSNCGSRKTSYGNSSRSTLLGVSFPSTHALLISHLFSL